MRRLTLALAMLSATIVIVVAGYVTFIVGDAMGESDSFLAYRNVTGAMDPTLLSGETFTVTSLRGEKGELLPVRRGDVVAHRWPPDPSKIFAKRVVGVPGDTIEMRLGKLRVNGRDAVEPHAWHEEPDTDPVAEDFSWQRAFLVGAASRDTTTYHPSRNTWGPILIPPGRFFVLGDNRDHSLDSRYWGLLPADDIIGRARRVYRSSDPRTGIRWRRLGHRIE
jgi:signal peptidase I